MKSFFSFILLFCLAFTTFSQRVKNENLVYDENIHSVLFHRLGDQLDPPVITLGSTDQLKLSFDDMSNETYFFKYTFIHCDHEWNETNLEQHEYIDGFSEDEITKYEFSFNAIPGYIHYEVTLPNPNMRIRLSGNYILKVYLNDPSDKNVIFTRRFFVVEPEVSIEMSIPYYPKMLEYTRYKQQIDIALVTPDLFNAEPMTRINVVIQQNGRWDNAKVGLKPTSVSNNTLGYSYPNGIVFDGGNSFRSFNIESYWYKSMYVKDIFNEADGYAVILHTTFPRAKKEFETVADLNGRMVVIARKDQNPTTEGEYAWVHFFLKSPKIEGGDIYILGQLNDWQYDEKSKMQYDSQLRGYYGSLYVKQGYYDYLYSFLPDGKTQGDVTIIEGDHWETDNEYTVYVYYAEKVPAYDRLVGYRNTEAIEIKN
jgi:hypothetical protein